MCCSDLLFFFCLENTFSFFSPFHPAQGFSNFIMSMNHLEILFEKQMWFSGSGVRPEILHFYLAPQTSSITSWARTLFIPPPPRRFSSVTSSQLSLALSLTAPPKYQVVAQYRLMVEILLLIYTILYITGHTLQTQCWINEWTNDIGKINFL